MQRPLYKYLRRRYAVDLVHHGELKLGTLGDFRALEALDPERGDAGEGSTVEYARPKQLDWRLPHQDREFIGKFIGAPPDANIQIRNSLFESEEFVEDAWVYCLSTRLSHELYENFATDACVVISDPEAFLTTLTSQLSRHGLSRSTGHLGQCVYLDRRTHYRAPIRHPPVLVKPKRFSHQAEARMYWVPSVQPIAPVVVHVPELRPLLRLLERQPASAEA